jgi:hypothetical protein
MKSHPETITIFCFAKHHKIYISLSIYIKSITREYEFGPSQTILKEKNNKRREHSSRGMQMDQFNWF